MKKLLILIAVTFISMNASAQFYLGAKAGVAASWTPRTVIVGNETIVPHNGFFGGATFGYDIQQTLCMESGIYYTGRGHSDRRPEVGSYSRSLHYLLVPVYAGLRLGEGRFSILLGPEFGYLLGCNVKEGNIKYNGMEDMNRFNILIGGELRYMFIDQLGALIRVESGLNRNFKNEGLLEKDKATNLSVSIGLAYKFGFDR